MNATKQKILKVSLELFSRYGYSAVSIRDICRQVQIKESTVYYHFKNKQAILKELLARFEQTAEGMMSRLEQAILEEQERKETLPGTEKQNGMCEGFFEQYLMDGFCNQVMRLLSIEQFHDKNMQGLYDYWMFERPLGFQEKVFRLLMEAGILEKSDSAYLAVKFYGPIFVYAQRWLFSGSLSEERKNAFREAAYGHVKKFFREMGEAKWQTS